MENQIISLRLPADGLGATDFSLAMDELLGTGNYVLTAEPKARGFQDEELGYSPEIASFVISIVSSTVAKILSNLITSELEKIKKAKEKDAKDKDNEQQ